MDLKPSCLSCCRAHSTKYHLVLFSPAINSQDAAVKTDSHKITCITSVVRRESQVVICCRDFLMIVILPVSNVQGVLFIKTYCLIPSVGIVLSGNNSLSSLIALFHSRGEECEECCIISCGTVRSQHLSQVCKVFTTTHKPLFKTIRHLGAATYD